MRLKPGSASEIVARIIILLCAAGFLRSAMAHAKQSEKSSDIDEINREKRRVAGRAAQMRDLRRRTRPMALKRP